MLKFLTVLLVPFYCLMIVIQPVPTFAQSSTDGEIQQLKREIKALMKRVEQLEQNKSEEREVTQELEAQEKKTDVKLSNLRRYVDKRIQKFSVWPESKLFISGYGALTFENSLDSEPSTFKAEVFPIFHYKLTDSIHFIFELEFELEGNELETGLEIGQADIFLNDYLTVTAGKFLLPFNAFSERLHPRWLNKMPSRPVIYGGPVGIIPVLSDVGVMIRGGIPLSERLGSKLSYSFYVTNGPRFAGEEEGEEHDDEEEGEGFAESALSGGGIAGSEIIFGSNFTDNNSNKAVGGRIGILPIWNMEFGGSFMYADAGSNIDVFLLGFDAEFHYRGLELRGEYIFLQNDNDEGGEDKTQGFYLQGSYRLSGITFENKSVQRYINRLEPVARFGGVFRDELEDVYRVTFGIDYWLTSSVPLKIAYEINDGLPERFLVQLAFGF